MSSLSQSFRSPMSSCSSFPLCLDSGNLNFRPCVLEPGQEGGRRVHRCFLCPRKGAGVRSLTLETPATRACPERRGPAPSPAPSPAQATLPKAPAPQSAPPMWALFVACVSEVLQPLLIVQFQSYLHILKYLTLQHLHFSIPKSVFVSLSCPENTRN